MFLITKEPLNIATLKPLLAVHKKALIGRVFLGNKPVVSQVHLYDILVTKHSTSALPWTCATTRISYSSWDITIS